MEEKKVMMPPPPKALRNMPPPPPPKAEKQVGEVVEQPKVIESKVAEPVVESVSQNIVEENVEEVKIQPQDILKTEIEEVSAKMEDSVVEQKEEIKRPKSSGGLKTALYWGGFALSLIAVGVIVFLLVK